MSDKEIKKLIALAHSSIIRTKGKEYAPTSHEIQKWIDKHYLKIDTNESTDAGSSGSYSGPINNTVIKRKINKINNFNINEEVNFDDIEDLFNNNPEYLNKIYNLLGYGPTNVIYSAIFFDTNEVTSKYEQVYPNLFSHHSTIEFKPSDITNLPIGKEIKVRIKGKLTTDKVDVLIVDNPLSKNKYPHITLSTAEGIKPFESNSEIEKNQDKIEQVNDYLEGVIGIFDGKSEIIEINVTEEEKEHIKNILIDYMSSNNIENFDIQDFENFLNMNGKNRLDETLDSGSSGSYDVPLFGGTKGRKNPLSIGGEKSVKSSRAVKDKNFPKWGGPGGVFIKIKDKCKKYPYCNQGIDAIELLENEQLNNHLKNLSNKYDLPYKLIEKNVLNEIYRYLSNMRKEELNFLLENEVSNRIKKYIFESKDVYHITSEGEPIQTCETEDEANKEIKNLKKKYPNKQFLIDKAKYESHEDMIEKLDKMGENMEKKEMKGNTKIMNEKLTGKQKNIDKNKNGKIDSEDFKMLRSKKSLKEKEDCLECNSSQMNEKLIGKQKNIDKNKNGKIDSGDFKLLRGKKPLKEKEDCLECSSKGYMKETKTCPKCGKKMSKGVCNECGKSTMNEEQLFKLIKKIVMESVPGLEVYKKSHRGSGDENSKNISDVTKKIKDYLTIGNNTNEKFPNQNNKGDKVARKNTPEQEDEIRRNYAGLENLDYDIEPSKEFKERMKKAIHGDSKMGNGSSNGEGNVIPTDTPKKIDKQVKDRQKDKDNRVLYDKEQVPVKTKINEEIDRIKKISFYNEKTQ